LARVIRAAIVGSGTRKACAMSAVATPHTSRSVSAIWASCASAGWQQVKTSRSRSSGIGPAGSGGSAAAGSTSRGSLRRSTSRCRTPLSAVRRATVVSHAPGRSGTPSLAQRFSAWR